MASKKFLTACKEGKVRKVEAAIKEGVDVNMTTSDTDRKTPLILAAEGGHKDVMSLLIKNHARVDGQDYYGNTALHWAAIKGSAEIVRLLIEHSADVDYFNKAFLTPLHEAAAAGKAGVIKVLLKSHADVMLTDNHGKTALDLANEFNKATCIKYLKKGMEKAQKRNNRKLTKKKSKHSQTQSMNTMMEGRPESARGKNMTETEKLREAISYGNFFGDDDDHRHDMEQLQAQNRRLKKRVDKLQTKNNALNAEITKILRENERVSALKATIQELEQNISEMEAEHKKAIQDKDREIRKLKLNKERLQTENKERLKMSQEFEEKLKVLELQNSKQRSMYGDDEEILEMIEECGDDVDKLKQTLYDVMEGLKFADDLNSEQQRQLEEMEDTLKESSTKPSTPNSDRKRNSKNGRKRANSKAKKIAKFEKWMENEVELPQYIEVFHEQGLARLDKIKGLEESDLEDWGISDKAHRLLIIEKIGGLRSRKQSAVRAVAMSETEYTPNEEEEGQHKEE